ncbi:MAG: ATP-binding protein [Bacillota bacterium]
MNEPIDTFFNPAVFQNLSVYRDTVSSGPAKTVRQIIMNWSGPGSSVHQEGMFAGLFFELAFRAEERQGTQVGNMWQDFLLESIIMSENPFTRMASAGQINGGSHLGTAVKKAAAEDLGLLKALFDIDFNRFNTDPGIYSDLLTHQPGGEDSPPPPGGPQYEIHAIKTKLLASRDWSDAADLLADFHLRCGFGDFCRYHAFRWDGINKALKGISNPDPIRLENLVGYENQRQSIIENTKLLLEGLPAGNILLYGDRGTGKSSTVKALIHRFGAYGLRIIEVPRDFIGDYPEIVSAVERTGLKFIFFVDDLSFEDRETEYKAFKSFLEGGLQAKPGNIAVYATSNRRHIIKESFEDRHSGIGNSDTLQEKLSLSDRFSTTLLFLSPDQELYLKIVEGLARQRGLSVPPGELRLRALEWERWNNSRSGRTASQFIDHLWALQGK